MPAGPVLRPWRRYLRFSVRGLIVLVLVIGVGLGWMVRVVRTAQIQRDAVAAIKNAGGMVAYDGKTWRGPERKDWEPWSRQWLTDHIGVDYFAHFTDVYLSFSSSTATDAAVGQARHLTRVKLLDLDQSSVSDAGLAHLNGLTKFSSVDLSHTQVTDAGLVHLKGLSNLSVLVLDGPQVSDAGLAHLKGLTKLSGLAPSQPRRPASVARTAGPDTFVICGKRV